VANAYETKRQKFVDLAYDRLDKLVKRIERLADLANTYAYPYTETDIDVVFSYIREELDRAEHKFREELRRAELRSRKRQVRRIGDVHTYLSRMGNAAAGY